MPLDDVKLHLVNTFDQAQALMSWLGTRDAADWIAVDTETTGLVQGVDHVRLAQFGGFVHGWAVPWHSWNGLVSEVIQKYRGRWVMHNAKFDAGMLSHSDLHVPRHLIDDTFIMAKVLEPHKSGALKTLAARYVDELAAGAQAVLDDALDKRHGEFTWATVPIDFGPYWQYAALDAVLTRHLAEARWPTVQRTCPHAYEVELDILWITERMERRGVHVDVPYAKYKYDDFMTYVDEAAAWVKEHYGISAGSNQAVVRVLTDAGYEFTAQTRAGAVQLDKTVLGGINHPLAKTILQRRQLQKLATTYLRHFAEDADADDLLHPNFNTLGARTSRMSMSNPNLQNLPRTSENNLAANAVRNSITARDDHTLLFCDFDQIEMRLLAHLSDDDGLRSAFGGDVDFFVSLARDIFQDPTLEKKDPRRAITKNVGYAQIYGAGLTKMAQTAGVPVAQVKVVKDRFDALYPGVSRFIKQVESDAWKRQQTDGLGYAMSPLTGRRHYADTNKIYALVNYLIQGSAAEAFKMKAIELDNVGLGDWMTLFVHDEVQLDVPNEHVPEAIKVLEDVMNDYAMFSVPITASVARGQRWGAKEDIT